MRIRLSLTCPICGRERLLLIEHDSRYVEVVCPRCEIGYRVSLTYIIRRYVHEGVLDWARLIEDLHREFYSSVVLANLRRVKSSGKSSNVLKHVG